MFFIEGFLLFLILLGIVMGPVMCARVLRLTRETKELGRRVDALEALIAAGPSAHRVQAQPAQAPPSSEPSEPPPVPPSPPGRTAIPVSLPRQPERNLEALIGGNWLVGIGVVAVLFGAAFFLKYAFDNRWIGETGRVILGLIAGLVFLGLGEWYQNKGYRRFGQTLTGGGIGLLYLSIYAAFGFYHLVPQLPAFLFMILVTAASVALAVRYDSLAIAIVATLGGFLTPFLLSTGVDNEVGLFSYILLLNVGILGVAYFRNWPILNYQSFVLTVTTVIAWAMRFYEPPKLWTTVLFLTLFFLVFAFLAILYNIIHRRKASAPESVLAFLNAGLYFGTTYFLLEDQYARYLGLFALIMGGAYVGLSYLTDIRHKEDQFLIWFFLGLAATFVTLAVPIQLKQNWITIGWAIEGAFLVFIGCRYNSRNTLLASLVILVLVFFRLIFIDAALPHQFVKEEFTLIFNRRAFSFAIGIAAMLFAAYFFAKRPRGLSEQVEVILGSLLIAANLLAIILLSVEAHDYFRYLYLRNRISPSALSYAQGLSLSIIWTLYSTFLIILGIWKGYRPIRYMALLLFGITILKVFLVDLSELERFYRIISFVVLGIILIAVSLLYQKYKAVLIGPGSEEGKS